MFYKIVVIPGSQPDNPIVQRGEFVRREEPPVLTALATEYGDPDKLAVQCLAVAGVIESRLGGWQPPNL